MVGSSGLVRKTWLSTQESWLDITNFNHWSKYFEFNQVDRILAEHVIEHLHPHQLKVAIENFFLFLRPGGYVRIAVPDGNHPSLEYIQRVKPGGTGPGASDHKVLYTFSELSQHFTDCGFIVIGLEYFDNSQIFHQTEWESKDGPILRSRNNDPRNSNDHNNYSSIIIDAVKPD